MIDLADQKKFVSHAVRIWMAQDVKPAIEQALAKKKRRVPAGLEDEIKQEFIEDLAGSSMGLYHLSFSDAGRMVDMRPKSMEWQKAPITKKDNFMSAWARKYKKRLKTVPGYESGKAPNLSKDEQIERFANAIIFGYAKGQAKRKRRGAWYNKTKNRLINKLISRLIDGQQEFFTTNVRDHIQSEGLNGGKIVL